MTVQLPEITGGTDKQNAYATAIRKEFVDRILRYDPTESGMAFVRSLTNPNAVVWLDAKSKGRLGSGGTEFFMDLAEFGQDSELWQGRAGISHAVYGKYLKPLQAPTVPPSALPPSVPEPKVEGAKTVREFIANATKGAKTQVDLDKVWASGFATKIREAFPNASPSEIMYEWDSVKNGLKKMVKSDR